MAGSSGGARTRAGHGAVISRSVLIAGPYQVDLTRKNINRAYLRVRTASGPVEVSAPRAMAAEAVERFVLSQAGWIERRRAMLAQKPSQEGKGGRNGGHILPDGRVLLWGEPVPPEEVLAQIGRTPRPQTLARNPEACVRESLRGLVLRQALTLVRAWEPRLGVSVGGLAIHDTKTRWGSCNVRTHKVNLSLSLVHYPKPCLELIVVHELTHLLEASHNARFYALMDAELPDWRATDALLKSLSR